LTAQQHSRSKITKIQKNKPISIIKNSQKGS
jgi:hypothetical protein